MENATYVTPRWESMLRIRRFEEQVVRLGRAGVFPGHYHVYIGQEATAVMACENLTVEDMIFTTWRNHGHLLARGAKPERMLAEILGKGTGYCGGKAGTLHMAAKELGAPATSAMVGGALPLATGAALGLKQQKSSGIVVAFFGDVALEEGAFYEAINLAAIWKVPILYVCENNSMPPEKRKRGQFPSSTLSAAELADVPRALQIPCEIVDGADTDSLSECFHKLVGEVRRTGSARFVEVRCTRWPGNIPLFPELTGGEWNLEWVFGEKPELPELATWVEKSDPLLLYGRRLVHSGQLTKEVAQASDARVRQEMATAARIAESSPWPDPAEATQGTFAAGRRL